ncbi:MAG: hypothetical protein DWQ05_14540 [Calditrichaeota bacterium]|nr:MAG: hypothetical protein DWQ05_14540 [Calditrichota bacterium]
MNNQQNFSKLIMLIFGALVLSFFCTLSAFSKENGPKRGSLDWFLKGPQKTWSPSDYNTYYEWADRQHMLAKKSQADDQLLRRQNAVINGNKITTEIWNYGSISRPGNTVTDIVWEGLGYGYEFGPFIITEIEVPRGSHRDVKPKRDENGAVVTDQNGDTLWVATIISDGLISSGAEISPDGREFWTWQPLSASDQGIPYGDPLSTRIPTSNDIDRDGDGKPDSWPEGWYNPNIKNYVWPGALRQGSSNADLESFFVVDDRSNKEFEYYPFPDDSTRRGLGIQIECRYYQWSNPLAEDIIFLIYKVTNVSDKDLTNVTFGMYGDPHVGGPSDWSDDLAYFARDINMVYAWDENGKSVNNPAITPGYFGYKFLESPGNPFDGIDNDNDGMIDESMTNGIDDDNDWNPEKDDVGLDGVPNTGDEGEDDGMPTPGDPFDIRKPGEPHFEWTDLDESDQIGLTSFAGPPFGGQNAIRNDEYMYDNYLRVGHFDTTNIDQAGDNIFLYGSGTFRLPAGQSRRFSVALLVGQDFEDLTLNAETAQQIYEINYQFAKPPEKPIVTVIPGDEKVTLYWDKLAESSFDPIAEEEDFEGYVIYRSTDPNFLDQQVITDANGSRFLFEPLKNKNGAPVRFDLINDYSGLSNILFQSRGIAYNLGNNTGLQHSFVDENNVRNGQTYYYAVVSYDHGSDSLGVPPSECSKTITVNPETNEIIFDVNTAQAVPRVAAAGFEDGHLQDTGTSNNIIHESGSATGIFKVDVIDPQNFEEDNEFELTIQENPTRYTVEDLLPVESKLLARLDQFVQLPNKNVRGETFKLESQVTGKIYTADADFELLAEDGLFRSLVGGAIPDRDTVLATYTYFPIFESERFAMQEGNPIFDGMTIYAQDFELDLNDDAIKWSETSKTNYIAGNIKPFNNINSNKYPGDFEVRFANELISNSGHPSFAHIRSNFEIWDVTTGRIPEKLSFIMLDEVLKDSLWTPGERIILQTNTDPVKRIWELTFLAPDGVEPIAPTEGDVFYIGTHRPFNAEDVYTFKTTAAKIVRAEAKSNLNEIAVVPNPYVVTNVIEPVDRQNPFDRGARRLYFKGLPQNCTIRIFTTTGELVDTIEHSAAMNDGQAYWDLTTKDNFPIAYGIYIYHVDAGDLGEKIGRFAVIK